MKKTANQKIWKMMSLLLCLGIFVFTSCDPEALLPGTPDIPDEPDVPVVQGDWTKPINEPTIWSGKVTVKGTVYVNAGLTIKPGTVVTFREDAQLYVQNEGFIHAVGLADTIIVLKAYEQGADWQRIYINDNAGKSSKFAYCHISGAEKAIEVYYNKVSVDNCIIKDCSVNGVDLYNSEFGSFTANTISDCEEYPVVVPFLQATAVTSDNEISGIGICLSGNYVGKKNGKVTIHEQTIPYVMSDSWFYIEDNAEVTIEPGVTIAMPEDAEIRVGNSSSGKLTAVGTAEKPITFTSNLTDKAAGDWEGIRFEQYNSKSSAMKYCNIEYSGSGYGAIYLYNTAIALENCKISDSENYGVNAYNESTFSSFTNNVIVSTGLYPVRCSAAAAGTIGSDNQFGELGIEIEGNYLTDDATWANHKVPYTISDSWFYIEGGNTLTIDPGVTVQMSEDAEIRVGNSDEGKLVAVGTAEEPIVFTSARNDKFPGDWKGIQFARYAGAGSILSNCKILYAGGGYGSLYFYYCGGKVTVQDCEIAYSKSYGIYVWNEESMPVLSNNTYHDNDGGNYISGKEYTDSEM